MTDDGIWLDQAPYVPPLVACVGCSDPLQPLEVMIKWVHGKPLHPLCRQCFEGSERPLGEPE
jgi:hypothetical protein